MPAFIFKSTNGNLIVVLSEDYSTAKDELQKETTEAKDYKLHDFANSTCPVVSITAPTTAIIKQQ